MNDYKEERKKDAESGRIHKLISRKSKIKAVHVRTAFISAN